MTGAPANEAAEKLSRGIQESKRMVRRRTMRLAQEYFGDSAEDLKRRINDSRSALEDLPDRLPGGQEEFFRTLFQELMDNYARIEEAIDEAEKNVAGLDAEQLGSQGKAEGAGSGGHAAGDGRKLSGAPDEATVQAAQGAGPEVVEGAWGALGQTTEEVGQVVEGAQDALGGAVGQVAENVALGTLFLGQATDEAGQTVQRMVDENGNIVRIKLDETGNFLDEDLAGNLTELPAEEEYADEPGRTVRTVEDESGTLIQLQLDEDGSVRDISILPSAE